MKLAHLALTIGLLAASPVYADDDDTVSQLKQMAECEAVGMALMQMYNSMAASIDVLSPQSPAQLQKIRDSYRMLAQDQAKKAEEIAEVTKLALLPKLETSVQEQYVSEVAKMVAGIQRALNLGRYDQQRQVQTELMSTAKDCETLSEHLNKISTY